MQSPEQVLLREPPTLLLQTSTAPTVYLWQTGNYRMSGIATPCMSSKS